MRHCHVPPALGDTVTLSRDEQTEHDAVATRLVLIAVLLLALLTGLVLYACPSGVLP